MIVKAVAGGGGRGTRAVLSPEDIEPAYTRCRSEAKAAFGRDEVYVEAFLTRARHIEVQILGDGAGEIAHLGERDCSIQRRYQKIVEIAPAPNLAEVLRAGMIEAAVRFAKSVGYSNLGTFEFLVDTSARADAQPFVFIEANARLQVEHTVTEQVIGVDLVQTQIRLAEGASLAELGLDDPVVARPRGMAIQARVNMETVAADGEYGGVDQDVRVFRTWACGNHRYQSQDAIQSEKHTYRTYDPTVRFPGMFPDKHAVFVDEKRDRVARDDAIGLGVEQDQVAKQLPEAEHVFADQIDGGVALAGDRVAGRLELLRLDVQPVGQVERRR